MAMRKQILLGTGNPAKVAIVQAAVRDLPLNLVTLAALGISQDVAEDGLTTLENAKKKAMAYFERTGIPTLGMDGGLHIEKFPAEKQPGVQVKRIHGNNNHASDQDVLSYYISELAAAGGESAGVWEGSLALALSGNRIFSFTYVYRTVLVSRPSAVVIPGAPLSSITVAPHTGKYFSEIQWSERPDVIWIHQFLERHLNLVEERMV